MAPSRGLRVRTQCKTLDQFVTWFLPYFTDSRFFLPTVVQSTLGSELPFSLDLADGLAAFAGVGGVLETWPNAANRFGRPGMMIELRQVAQSSAPMLERIKHAKARAAEVADPTEISSPSYDELAQGNIATEEWDFRSAPVEKVEMRDVVRRPAVADEPDGPDEAEFTDDDQPTTLVQETDDSAQRGEDAYVQMAPIADALELSIPNEAAAPPPPVASDEPAPTNVGFEPPVPPTYAAPPMAATPPRPRTWPIALAIIAVVVGGAVVIAMFVSDTAGAPDAAPAVAPKPKL